MGNLRDLQSLSKEIHKTLKKSSNEKLKNKQSKQSKQSKKYARKLYKRILNMSDSCLILMNKKEYSAIPLIVRNMIESIVDLANIRLYGHEYVKHLEFSYVINELDFIRNNYEEYKNSFAPEEDDERKINEIKQDLERRKQGLFEELKENKINGLNYIQEYEIEYREYHKLKSYMTQKYKFELLLNEDNLKASKYKSKSSRHNKYKTGYYLMSKFIHNSIEFMPDYNPERNINAYINTIASILKNGLHYLSDINGVSIKNKQFNKLSKLKKKISDDDFYYDIDSLLSVIGIDIEEIDF